VQNLLGGDEAMAKSRTPAIVADAAWEIVKRKPGDQTGQALIDDEVLREAGKDDLSEYSQDDSGLQLDIFVADWG
jgi:hypothetical protein